MELMDEVSKALTAAMKAKDQALLGPLRMLKTALVNRSVEKGRGLDETESLQVVTSLVKQRRDSIEQFRNAGRHDLADKEAREIEVLETYLPPAAGPAEIEQAVAEAIQETGATTPKDIGKVMKAALARLAGKTADGKVVNEAVRRRLGGQ
jgi:uncharacterized protein